MANLHHGAACPMGAYQIPGYRLNHCTHCALQALEVRMKLARDRLLPSKEVDRGVLIPAKAGFDSGA